MTEIYSDIVRIHLKRNNKNVCRNMLETNTFLNSHIKKNQSTRTCLVNTLRRHILCIVCGH